MRGPVISVRPWPRRSSGVEPVAVLGGLTIALLAGFMVGTQGLLGFLGVIGLVVVLVVLRWPFIGLLILAGSIAVENLLVVEGAGGAATGTRFLGMAVFAGWILGKLLRRESVIPLLTSVLSITGGLLFAFALASTLWARVPQIALSGSIQLAQFIALAVLTLDLARSWERVDLLVKALVVGATVAAVLTVEQAVVGGARRAGGDIAGGINSTAILLVTTLPFAFYLLRSPSGVAWKVLGITYIGVGVTATILTYSRMNLLVLPVILTLLTFHTMVGRRGRVPILVAGVVAMGLGLYAIPTDRLEERLVTIVPYLEGTVGRDDTGIVEPSSRGYHLRVGFAIARDQPVMGAGFRNYGTLFRDEYQFVVPGAGRIYYSARSPHSTHVGMLANLGGIGMGLWVALLLGAGLVPAVRAWRRTAAEADETSHLASQAITYALGLQVFVYGWYTDIELGKLFWILLGLAVAVWALARTGAAGTVLAGRAERDRSHSGGAGRVGRPRRSHSTVVRPSV
jgi:hypothetical protein